MDKTMFWNLPVSSVRIGLKDYYPGGLAKAWKFRKPIEGCLDTGTTVVLVPESFYETFIKSLFKCKNPYYDYESDAYYAECDINLYESVYISIGNHFFEIPPSKFITIE